MAVTVRHWTFARPPALASLFNNINTPPNASRTVVSMLPINSSQESRLPRRVTVIFGGLAAIASRFNYKQFNNRSQRISPPQTLATHRPYRGNAVAVAHCQRRQNE